MNPKSEADMARPVVGIVGKKRQTISFSHWPILPLEIGGRKLMKG